MLHSDLTRRTTLSGQNGLDLFGLVDVIQLAALSALTILQLGLWKRLPTTHVLIVLYAGAICAFVTTAYLARRRARRWLSLIDDLLLPIIILLVVFETLGYSIPAVNSTWFEPLAVAFDRRLFGMAGSVYLERFYNWVLLDLMHVFYVVFYLFPLSLMVIMYTRRARAEFRNALGAIGLTFYLCFLLYFFFPVLGPCRNPGVYEYFTKDIMASGGEATRYVRTFVKYAELTSYDCFPSAHAAVTLMTIFMAYRYKLSIRKCYLLPAVMILVSTVYLRYHYVIDILAGAFVAAGAYWLSCLAQKLFHSREPGTY